MGLAEKKTRIKEKERSKRKRAEEKRKLHKNYQKKSRETRFAKEDLLRVVKMESKSPAGVFPHKNKPSSIHISQQSQEAATGAVTTTNLTAPLTPRIDISRASSSSYHEDSSPENVFDQVTHF